MIFLACVSLSPAFLLFSAFFYKREMDNLNIEHVLSREGGFEQFLIYIYQKDIDAE